MNLQVIPILTAQHRLVSGPATGSVHDKKAVWIWGVLDELDAVVLITLADKGNQGARYAENSVQGKGQVRVPETDQPRARETPMSAST